MIIETLEKRKKGDRVVEDAILKALNKDGKKYFMQKNIAHVVLTVTSALAISMLDRNTVKNRKKKKGQVNKIKKQLVEGKWMLSGDTIKFDINGVLVDGQHRLNAIIESGVSADVLIVYGVQSQVFLVIDTNKNRGGGDILETLGVKDNSRMIANSFALINGFETKTIEKHDTPDHSDLMGLLKKHPIFVDSFKTVKTLNDKESVKVGAVPQMSVLHYLVSRKHGKKSADSFINALYTGTGINTGSPVKVLRDTFTNRKQHKAMHNADKLTVGVIAWNAFKTGKGITEQDVDTTRTIKGKKAVIMPYHIA